MNLRKIGGPVRGHQFSTFPNMVWQGAVLRSILEKVGAKAEAYQESLQN